VCGSFKASLHELVTKLSMTQPAFVRCIAPNPKQERNNFVTEHVQRQLRYTGVMETVRIRREGFAVRMFFDEFVTRYTMIHYTFDKPLLADPKAACEQLLTETKCDGWAVGRCVD
jgi:myosin-3